MHPLLHILVSQPDLLAEHAYAYVELVGAEIAEMSATSKRKALWGAAVLCCLVATVVLAGVALMLWFSLPASSVRVPWVLIVTPLLPAAVAVGCFLALQAKGQTPAFDKVRKQINADMLLLREVNAP
jgi:uncharacterized membrane protein YbhN (UPF0104 family)